MIEGEQKEDGKTQRNDRLLAVAESSHTHSDVRSVSDLNRSLLKEVEEFFVNYHTNDGTKFKVLGCKGPDAAFRQMKKSQRRAA